MPLQKLIGNIYSAIIEIALWLIPIAGMAAGYIAIENSLLDIPLYLAIIAGAIGGLLLDIILFGPVIILLNIRASLKNVAKK